MAERLPCSNIHKRAHNHFPSPAAPAQPSAPGSGPRSVPMVLSTSSVTAHGSAVCTCVWPLFAPRAPMGQQQQGQEQQRQEQQRQAQEKQQPLLCHPR